MKTAGIVIEDWKLPIFSKRLVAANFDYTQGPGLTEGTYLLTVKVLPERMQQLGQLALAANKEAARMRK